MFEYHKETLRQSEESFELILYLNCKTQQKKNSVKERERDGAWFFKKIKFGNKAFCFEHMQAQARYV